jgi:hypothetical protein
MLLGRHTLSAEHDLHAPTACNRREQNAFELPAEHKTGSVASLVFIRFFSITGTIPAQMRLIEAV